MDPTDALPITGRAQCRDAANASAGEPADAHRHEVGDRHEDQIHAGQLRPLAVQQIWDQDQVDQHGNSLIKIVRRQPREVRSDHAPLRGRPTLAGARPTV